MSERIEVRRLIAAPAADIFALLCDPAGARRHRRLRNAAGRRRRRRSPQRRHVRGPHGPRVAQRLPGLGKYDVTVTIREFVQDALISWTILGQMRPQIGHVYGYRLEPADARGTLVTSFYDWSDIHPDWREADIFPVISESALRGTLGILDRTVRRGYSRAAERGQPRRHFPGRPGSVNLSARIPPDKFTLCPSSAVARWAVRLREMLSDASSPGSRAWSCGPGSPR